ncbi:tryptophan synthase beta subunit-like PLP-dependent enzyme [Obba rivulosa]|uniref:L-serine ammonia-lyase n=1 Tax=Obba rivulosa TaxID=1052685 RepID=A0A8E2J7V1_9APHY|nr:tryptophan synthase beta subunit-like PLP-dependent enzyme [Obba rivulosa]
MVPAYDDPIVWEGHSSIVTEMSQQLPPGTTPDAILCSVGGGGLLGGIIQGCNKVGWEHVRLVTLETLGSNCFYESLALNPGVFSGAARAPHENVTVVHDEVHDVQVAHLAKLTSQATSLGAPAPSAGVVKMALQHKGGIKSVCIPDALAMQAGMRFADEHKVLVELACATTLAPAYWGSQEHFDKLVPPREDGRRRTVVFEVCGGFKISLAEMEKHQKEVEAEVQTGEAWRVLCNGEQWSIQATL